MIQTFQNVVALAGPNDAIQVELQGDSVTKWVTIHSRGVISLDDLLMTIENLSQSKSELFSDDTLAVQLPVQIVHNPTGVVAAQWKLTNLLKSDIVQKKLRCLFVSPSSDNNLCLAHCVARLLNPRVSLEAKHLQGAAGLRDTDVVSFTNENSWGQECCVVLL